MFQWTAQPAPTPSRPLLELVPESFCRRSCNLLLRSFEPPSRPSRARSPREHFQPRPRRQPLGDLKQRVRLPAVRSARRLDHARDVPDGPGEAAARADEAQFVREPHVGTHPDLERTADATLHPDNLALRLEA